MSGERIRLRPVEDFETKTRRDLAAAFRWAARLGFNEGIANHFSAAVSDDGSQFLLNPDGRHFSRIRASDLLLLDARDPDAGNGKASADATAWFIHAHLHVALPHARCILHTHMPNATALSCLKEFSFPPLEQNAMRYFGRVAWDNTFNGMALDDDEGRRIASALGGDKYVLMMANHGVTVIGSSVAEAFDRLYYFERACQTLVLAMSTGRELNVPSDAVAMLTRQQWDDQPELIDKHLSELRTILDDEDPSYAN